MLVNKKSMQHIAFLRMFSETGKSFNELNT